MMAQSTKRSSRCSSDPFQQGREATGCARCATPFLMSQGVAAKRPGLKRVLDEIEAGDVLVVTKLDRLPRSTLDLLRIVDLIGREGAEFKSLGELWAEPRRRQAV